MCLLCLNSVKEILFLNRWIELENDIKSCLIKDLMKDNYGEGFWKVKFQEGCWNSVSHSPQKKALTEIYRLFEKKDPKCKEKLIN